MVSDILVTALFSEEGQLFLVGLGKGEEKDDETEAER